MYWSLRGVVVPLTDVVKRRAVIIVLWLFMERKQSLENHCNMVMVSR